LERQTVEKGIHDIGFAAPDTTPQIQTTHRSGGLFVASEQFRKNTGSRQGSGRGEIAIKSLHVVDSERLGIVRNKLRGLEVYFVALSRTQPPVPPATSLHRFVVVVGFRHPYTINGSNKLESVSENTRRCNVGLSEAIVVE